MVALVLEETKKNKLNSLVLLGEERHQHELRRRYSKILSMNAFLDYLKIVNELEKNADKIQTQIKYEKVYKRTLGIDRMVINLDWNENYIKQCYIKPLSIEPINVAKYSPVNSDPVDKKLIPAISCLNEQTIVLNKDAIVFPKDISLIKPTEKTHGEQLKEKLQNLSRKQQSEETQERVEASREGFRYDDDDDDQSILIQKLRELIIRFEKLLAKYLDPDIPKGRADRKKWEREEMRFRAFGYKDFINSIDLKVEALCNFENFEKEQFCLEGDPNWFKRKIAEALKGNFYSAQEVVNSVMQIVKEEEYAIPKRRLVTKLK